MRDHAERPLNPLARDVGESRLMTALALALEFAKPDLEWSSGVSSANGSKVKISSGGIKGRQDVGAARHLRLGK